MPALEQPLLLLHWNSGPRVFHSCLFSALWPLPTSKSKLSHYKGTYNTNQNFLSRHVFPLSYISSVFSLWSGETDGDIYKEGQHYILMRRYLVRLHAYPNSQDWKVYYPSYVIPEDERIPSSEVYWKESYWSIQIREWWISFSRHNLRNGTSLPRNISYTRSISARSM